MVVQICIKNKIRIYCRTAVKSCGEGGTSSSE